MGGGLGLLMGIEVVNNRKTKTRYPGGFNGEFATRFTDIVRGNGLAIRVGDSITFSRSMISRRGQYHGSSPTAMSVGNRGRRTHGMFEPFSASALQVDPPYCI